MLPRRSLLALGLLASCSPSARRRIGVIPKATAHRFFVTIHAGVDAAARDHQVDVLWNGPSEETDHNRQIQIVDSMIAQRLDAIAISATEEHALAAPLERALKAGIPVTIFDSGVNLSGYVSFIATGNEQAGVTAARRLAALVGQGKVAMIMQKPGGTSTGLRESGFAATLEREFPQIELAARQYGMSDPARSRAAAENILTAHPDLKGIFASSEAASLGAILALRGRGLAGKICLVTFDTSDAHIAALKDGTIDLMLVQDAYRIGYEAVSSLANYLNKTAGEKSPSEQKIELPAREVRKADLSDPAIARLVQVA